MAMSEKPRSIPAESEQLKNDLESVKKENLANYPKTEELRKKDPEKFDNYYKDLWKQEKPGNKRRIETLKTLENLLQWWTELDEVNKENLINYPATEKLRKYNPSEFAHQYNKYWTKFAKLPEGERRFKALQGLENNLQKNKIVESMNKRLRK